MNYLSTESKNKRVPGISTALLIAAFLFFLTLSACSSSGGDDDNSTPADTSNTAPTASAGSDQTLDEGSNVLLDGSASSDSDGTIISWNWEFDEDVTKIGETVNYSFNQTGVYIVTLTVTDDDGATGNDTILVTIIENNTIGRADDQST